MFVDIYYSRLFFCFVLFFVGFFCVEVLRPSQPNGVMSSASVYLTTFLLGRLSSLSG